MKVIFLQDVPPNARAGDVKEVKNGYARNYLLPRNLATTASAGELKRVESLRREAEVRRLKEAEEWREVAAKLAEEPVEILVRSGPRGRLYGSVTNSMLAEKLTEISGAEVDRRGIRFEVPVRQLGEYTVPVRYFEGVEGQVQLHVVSEDGGAEAAAMEAAMAEAEAAEAGAAGQMTLLEEFEARRKARELRAARERGEVADEQDDATAGEPEASAAESPTNETGEAESKEE